MFFIQKKISFQLFISGKMQCDLNAHLELISDYFKENDSEFPELNRFELARRIWNINHIDNEVPKIESYDFKSLFKSKT